MSWINQVLRVFRIENVPAGVGQALQKIMCDMMPVVVTIIDEKAANEVEDAGGLVWPVILSQRRVDSASLIGPFSKSFIGPYPWSPNGVFTLTFTRTTAG